MGVGPVAGAVVEELEELRGELTGYCYRMPGPYREAEDAVQETWTPAGPAPSAASWSTRATLWS